MSQPTRSWAGRHPVLALLLAALGLWLAWHLLLGVYRLLGEVALRLFLTLDASYGQLGSPVVGYALLGLLLGAAAGAAAARRRFQLGRGIGLGAAMLALALLGLAYAGSRWLDEPATPEVVEPMDSDFMPPPAAQPALAALAPATASEPAHELRLPEITQGQPLAQCVLQRQQVGYAGTMHQADGQQLTMNSISY